MGLVLLNVRMAARRPLRLVLAVVAVATSSALTVSVWSTVRSIVDSATQAASLGGGSDLIVAAGSAAGFPGELTEAARRVEGVRAVVPLLRQHVSIGGRDGLLLGIGPGAPPGVSAPAGCIRLTGTPDPGGVVLGPAFAGRHPPAAVTVSSAPGMDQPVPVIGVADCGAVRRLNRGRLIGAPLATAQSLAGRPGTVDGLLVWTAPGSTGAARARLAAVVAGRALVGTPAEIGRVTTRSLQAVVQLLLLVVALTVVVSGFLVFNTIAMTTLERRRELATLRALGGSPRRLMAGIVAEATALGVVGALLGLAAGAVITARLVHGLPAALLATVGVFPAAEVPGAALGLGLAVGIGAAAAGGLLPARHAVQVPPVDAMRPEGVLEADAGGGGDQPFVAAGGAGLFLAGFAAATLTRPPGPVVGTLAMQAGFVAGTYGIAGSLARGAAGVAGRLGAAGRLAAASVARAPRRAWATAAAVGVSVGIIVVALGGLTNQQASFSHDYRSLARAQLWAQTVPLSQLPAGAVIPTDTLDRIGTLPGVAGVSPGHAAYLTTASEQLLLEAFGGPSSAPIFANARPAARQALLAGRGAIVNRHYAVDHHLRVGAPLTLDTPVGPRSLPIADTVDMLAFTDGLIGVPLDWYETNFGSRGATWVELTLRPGADRASVAASLRATMGEAPITIGSGPQLLAAAQDSVRRSAALFQGVNVVIVLGATLAVLNTLLLGVTQRRRELGVLRALGASRLRLALAVLAEAAGLSAVGAVLGTVLGEAGHVAGLRAVGALVGVTIRYQFRPEPLLLAIGAAALTALVGAALPAWRAGSINVIDALAYE